MSNDQNIRSNLGTSQNTNNALQQRLANNKRTMPCPKVAAETPHKHQDYAESPTRMFSTVLLPTPLSPPNC